MIDMRPALTCGQHQRHLRLDARKAAIDVQMSLRVFSSRRMRRVVGGDHVDRAVSKRVPQRLLVALLAHRRIDAR